MKIIFNILLSGVIMLLISCSQPQNVKTTSFKVWGNCGMCKKTIEKSLKADGISSATWNTGTKMIEVSYDSTRVTLDEIHLKIAAAGYDTEKERGNDEAYSKLHSCCQYERKN